MISYGAISQFDVVKMTRAVCNVLGNGVNNNAHQSVIEIMQQETHLGEYRDVHPHKFGVGLAQFDEIGFNDVKRRTRSHNIKKINDNFGIAISSIQHRELAYSPLLSIIWCRLFLILRPDVIPTDLVGRAQLWKMHYNTVHGKGSVTEYIENAKRIKVGYL